MTQLINFRRVFVLILVMKFLLVSALVYGVYQEYTLTGVIPWDERYGWFLLVGFVAQIIDGALGMAYGVTCSSLLLGLGVPPAAASASVHTAEVFTTGVSGISHLFFQNVNKELLLKLVFGGVIGSAIGAYLISRVFEGDWIKPFVCIYLLFLGLRILWKSFAPQKPVQPYKHVGLLGFFGGLFDAIGGGGWGPIVTSNLLDKSNAPREVIGSVSTAEFFVTFVSTGVFLFFVGIQQWVIVVALMLGGMVAAPLGAWLVRLIPARTIMRFAGVLIIVTSAWTIYRTVWL